MMKRFALLLFLLLGICPGAQALAAEAESVPAVFQASNPSSNFRINYADIDALFKYAVIDVGRSTREYAAPVNAATGSKIKTSVKASTINEGNRFYFELFKGDEQNRQVVEDILKGLQAIPSQVPLENFSRDEQLAYWLNLYNLAMINEVIAVYPKRSLKRLLVGRKSVLDKKMLEVSGVKLSLNDIRAILERNYDRNPLVIYGLYQGIIGGPNIRRRAYTGDRVWAQLEDNADEFINSNRGTSSRGQRTFRVSTLYERNEDYFPDFEADLTAHLLKYLKGREKRDLETASGVKANIDDWTVTDVYGTFTQAGGSFATNSAAMLDAVQASFPGEEGTGPVVSGNLSAPSSGLQDFMDQPPGRFSPEVLVFLNTIKDKQEATNVAKGGNVTVEELGQVTEEEEAKAQAERKKEDGGN